MIEQIMPTANITINQNSSGNFTMSRPTALMTSLLVGSYSTIFFLSLVGNGMVIITLVRHRRMRTVTNLLLLNLAVSDLFMAIVCMPPSLTAFLIRKFIFGGFLCAFQRYIQGVCVAISAYTLTTISLERFFAIVLPFWSRRWQTVSHAYKSIAIVWSISLVVMLPMALVSQLYWLGGLQVYKCIEYWPNLHLHIAYSVGLLVLVYLLPLVVMTTSYSLIARTLWRRSINQKAAAESGNCITTPTKMRKFTTSSNGSNDTVQRSRKRTCNHGDDTAEQIPLSTIGRQQTISKSRGAQSGTNKIVRMLIVVVLEFFICWTPVFVVNTWVTISPMTAKNFISPGARLFITLLSYCCTCCNPITYCFLHDRFRHHFLTAFGCCPSQPDNPARPAYSFRASTIHDPGYIPSPSVNNQRSRDPILIDQ